MERITSSSVSNQSEEPDGNQANVKVVVRIRPMVSAERSNKYETVTEAISDYMLLFDPKVQHIEGFLHTQHRGITGRRFKDLKYAFDYVLRGTARNRDVFEKTTQSIVKTVLNGYNCSVFAYGATGSGKTHTMLGNENEPGVIYHTMLDLYKQIDALKGEKIFSVAVSYLEVYNETVRDLLNPKKNLPIREDKMAGIMIAGLSLHKPDNAEDLLHMLHHGNKNRSQHPTDANAESSRSHAVFQVFVKQRSRSQNANSQVQVAKMCLVDLAGSERAIHTRNIGARFREGANINRSLLALGNVINALAAKSKGHIPYRDSKLTRLLKDSLGGNCQTVMIATISPSSRSYEDTYNTLRYADRAKHIRADLTKNVVEVDQHIVNYKLYVSDLEKENRDLREKARLLQESKVMVAAPSASSLHLFNRLQDKINKLFRSRKELMRIQITPEVVTRELKWKLSRKERAIKRVDKLTGLKEVVNKHKRDVERMQRRYLKEEVNLQKTQHQLKQHDQSIYHLNNELASQFNLDRHLKEHLAMSMRFYVTDSYLSDLDMHLCFVKKMARAQERQSVVNERIILSLIQLVRKQQDTLKSHNISNPDVEQAYKECCYLVEERGVTWVQHGNKGNADTTTTTTGVDNDNNKTSIACPDGGGRGEGEDEDLRISDIIDIQLPRIDFSSLKLDSLYASTGSPQHNNKDVHGSTTNRIMPSKCDGVQTEDQKTSLPVRASHINNSQGMSLPPTTFLPPPRLPLQSTDSVTTTTEAVSTKCADNTLQQSLKLQQLQQPSRPARKKMIANAASSPTSTSNASIIINSSGGGTPKLCQKSSGKTIEGSAGSVQKMVEKYSTNNEAVVVKGGAMMGGGGAGSFATRRTSGSAAAIGGSGTDGNRHNNLVGNRNINITDNSNRSKAMPSKRSLFNTGNNNSPLLQRVPSPLPLTTTASETASDSNPSIPIQNGAGQTISAAASFAGGDGTDSTNSQCLTPIGMREQKNSSDPDSITPPTSDKLNHTFEIDKPAIPNTPCIDVPSAPKHRRLTMLISSTSGNNSNNKNTTPIQMTSTSHFNNSSHSNSRTSSLSSYRQIFHKQQQQQQQQLITSSSSSSNVDKPFMRRQIFSTTTSVPSGGTSIITTSPSSSDNDRNKQNMFVTSEPIEYNNIPTIIDLSGKNHYKHNKLTGQFIGSISPNKNTAITGQPVFSSNSKPNLDKLSKFHAALAPSSPLSPIDVSVKSSPSLTKWRSLASSQRLDTSNSNNNCSIDLHSSNNNNDILHSFNPVINLSVDQNVRTSTPKMEVEVVHSPPHTPPISIPTVTGNKNTDDGDTTTQTNVAVKTPELPTLNPYMLSVIQSLKKHGLPSLTERLSMVQGSTVKSQKKQSSPPPPLRSRSPLRLLDTNSSKYQAGRQTSNTDSKPISIFQNKPAAKLVEQVTLLPPPSQDNSDNITIKTTTTGMKQRLDRVREKRRQQRELSAKPYSRGTILADQGQRLAAALNMRRNFNSRKGPTNGLENQELPYSSIAASTATATTTSTSSKPSYMSSTFAASQRVQKETGSGGGAGGYNNNKLPLWSAFSQQALGTQPPQRRPFMSQRNKSCLPWTQS